MLDHYPPANYSLLGDQKYLEHPTPSPPMRTKEFSEQFTPKNPAQTSWHSPSKKLHSSKRNLEKNQAMEKLFMPPDSDSIGNSKEG